MLTPPPHFTPVKSCPEWILSFTAGGFVYISLVSIIPEILEDSHKTTFLQTLMEVLAMCAGIFLMVLVALYE